MTPRTRVALVGLLAGGLLAGGAASGLPGAELPNDWKHWSHFRELDIPMPPAGAAGAGELVRVALPEALFEHGRSDLADLRVVDPRSQDVGYVVFDPGRGPETAWRATELVDIHRALARSPESAAGESWWEPRGRVPAVPIAAVRVETGNPAFHRPVKVSVSEDDEIWRQVGEGHIYRYPADEADPSAGEPGATRQSLQVDLRNTAAPFWRVTILDRGDPPITDLEVVLMHNRRYIVFRAAAGSSYILVYGNPRAEAPEYEIAELTTREALATARLTELGAEQSNDAWVSSEPFTERHPMLLWAMLGLAIIVLGGLALKALRS